MQVLPKKDSQSCGLLLNGIRSLGFLLVFLCPVLFQSCGGGTGGTGDIQITTVQGRLVNLSGAPVADATVSLPESGAESITDADGNFAIETPAFIGDISITVKSADIEASTFLITLSDPTATIDIQLELDEQNKSVRVVSTTIPPTPTPVPTVPSSQGPPPGSSIDPTPVPTVSSNSPPASPTSVSTPAPTPTTVTTPTVQTAIYKGVALLTSTQIGAAEGAIVEVVGTGGTAVVDSEANFYILAEPIGAIHVDVTFQGLTDRVKLDPVPAGNVRVCLTLHLEIVRGLHGPAGDSLVVSKTYQNVTDGSVDCTPDIQTPAM